VSYFYTSPESEEWHRREGLTPLFSGDDLAALARNDAVLVLLRDGFTGRMYERLYASGYRGHWVDAASDLRMDPRTTLILQPVNQPQIDAAFARGCTTWVGANCTTSIALIPFAPLFAQGLVRRMKIASYQAASGAGAEGISDLLDETSAITQEAQRRADLPPLDRARLVAELQRAEGRRATVFGGQPLAYNLLPFIDAPGPDGFSKEETKLRNETRKILGNDALEVSASCVRVPTLICHCVDMYLELTRPLPLDEASTFLRDSSSWVKLIPNDRDATLAGLTPAAFAGTPHIGVGRIRHTYPGDATRLSAFVVGDQTQWGAALPPFEMVAYLTRHLR